MNQRNRKLINVSHTGFTDLAICLYESEVKTMTDDNEKRVIAVSIKQSTMSVRKMREMLGLKKTESYWLVHREVFETILVNGRMRVVMDSFEAWYANQIKYHKVDGPPPGAELKERSFSPRDIAEMLDIPEHTVYDIIRRDKIPTIEVDCWMRVDCKVFFAWYAAQDHYRTRDDREAEQELEDSTMTMPQMAWFLNVPRRTVYQLLSQDNDLETVVIAGRRRVKIDSFWRWYAKQDKYEIHYTSLKLSNQVHAEAMYEINCTNFRKIAEAQDKNWGSRNPDKEHRRKSDRGAAYSRKVTREEKIEPKDEVINGVLIPAGGVHENRDMNKGSDKYYSIEEVMKLMRLTRRTILEKIRRNEIPAVKIAHTYRIPRAEFDELMKK